MTKSKKKKKNDGKLFERDFVKSVPPSVLCHRNKDTIKMKGGKNICDFILYRYPNLYLLELKTHLGKAIPFNKLSDTQIQGLYHKRGLRGIRSGFIFNFREYSETYYMSAEQIYDYIMYADRKSFPIDWCRRVGVKVGEHKIRVRSRYEVDKFLDDII